MANTIKFPFAAAPGIVRDIEPYRLPPGVWSDGLNVMIQDMEIAKAFGYETFIDSPTISPKYLAYCPTATQGFWLYPGLTKVYAFDIDGTTADVTRSASDYTGSEDNRWNFAFLHGTGLLNNGADAPQMWVGPGLSTLLADLTNWPSSTTAVVLRTFLNYVIALDVTKSSTRYQHMVKWSHPAAAGSVPSSWDETDATKDAGEVLLSDTTGKMVDCLPLGGVNIVYKEDSTYAMKLVGGQAIFGFVPIFKSVGLLAQDCAVSLQGSHFVVTPSDVLVHNGVKAESIVSNRNRTWLYNNIEPAGYQNCFAFPWTSRGEVWFCFPLTGSAYPNMALVWNEEQNSTTFREIPPARQGIYTPPQRISSGDAWSSEVTQTWAGETSLIWDEPSFTQLAEHIFLVNATNDDIEEFGRTEFQDGGTSFRSYVERQSMPFIATNDRGEAITDFRQMKHFREIIPHITGSAGTEISVYVGVQNFPADTVTWNDPVTYTIGTTLIVPIDKPGRFLSVRFEATSDANWQVHGFEYDLDPLGVF